MPTFRTKKVQTSKAVTPMLENPKAHLTEIGVIPQKRSQDEISELCSSIVGDMSLIEPRPALFKHVEIIARSTELGSHKLPRGIMGWELIHVRDAISTSEKIVFDNDYLSRMSINMDARIFFATNLVVLAINLVPIKTNLKHDNIFCYGARKAEP